MSFRTAGAYLESSKLTFACVSGFSFVRIEVTCLDQNFASVDVGMAVVLKGLSFRDVGYGLRATIRSRGSFEIDDPCNLAVKWEGGDVLENLPLRLACCAAAQAISVRILVMIFSLLFSEYALCKLCSRGWLVFSCLVALGC